MQTENMDIFIQKVQTCDSMVKLELLHTVVYKSVPVAERGVYIQHLNDREDIITKGEKAWMAWSDE